jgi:hypothetical protein
MSDPYFSFSSLNSGHYPYINKLLAHDFDAGFIEFDGYFYTNQDELPVECLMEHSNGVYGAYKIEVTRVEKLEETSVYSEIEDDDGSLMRVCFFQTFRIKLWFRILEKIT